MLNVFITLATGGDYFSYLKRISDGLYFDTDDSTFKAFGSLVDGKIEFSEDVNISGQFSWSLSIPDGDYILYTLEDTGSGDVNVAQAKFVSIRQGQEQTTSIVDFNKNVLEAEITDCETGSVSSAQVFKFFSGEDRTIAIRINESINQGQPTPFSIPLGSTVTVLLPASGVDGGGNAVTSITKDNAANGGVVINNYDRGEITVSVDDVDTALMKSGDIIIQVDSGSVTRKARIASGIQKLKL